MLGFLVLLHQGIAFTLDELEFFLLVGDRIDHFDLFCGLFNRVGFRLLLQRVVLHALLMRLILQFVIVQLQGAVACDYTFGGLELIRVILDHLVQEDIEVR